MNNTIDRLKLIFIGIFLVLCVLMTIAQIVWIAPMKKCEAAGNWWAMRYLRCATPIRIEQITGHDASGAPTAVKEIGPPPRRDQVLP